MPGPSSSRPSFPSVPGEPRVRRLGVGSSGGGDRPLRAQVIVALVCAAMLVAVPLYLWRKPSLKGPSAPPARPSASGSAAGPGSMAAPAASVASAPAPPPRLTLGAVQKVRCGNSASASNEAALCDTLGPFEQALERAVLASEDCAPKGKLKGSINYVLTIDFPHKKLHVFPGASGEWRGKQARRAASCVAAAMKVDNWAIPHQFRVYAIAVLATYAGQQSTLPPLLPSASPSGPSIPGAAALPNFE